MDIRTVMTQVAAIEAGLAITAPVALNVKHAYKFFPAQKTILESPAFMNEYTMLPERRVAGLRKQQYEIHTQFFLDETNQDQASDVCSAFLAAFIDAFDAKVTLNGTCTTHEIRGGAPTLAILTRAQRDYVGLDLFIDVHLDEAKTFGV